MRFTTIDKINPGLAFLVASMLCIGVFLTMDAPAAANHPSDSCLDVSPETASNPTGTSHTVTATLRQGDTSVPVAPSCPGSSSDAPANEPTQAATGGPVVVNFEVSGANDVNGDGDGTGSPDFTCTIPSGQSSCTMPAYVGVNPGEDTIRGWINGHPVDADEPQDPSDEERASPLGDEPDSTDVVTKTWVGGDATNLDCSPEQDTNAAGDAHTVTCTARNSTGGFVQDAHVDAEATGVNNPDGNDSTANPDFTCTTDENGTCSFTHGPGGTGTTGSQGTTTYRAWIDSDNDNATFEGDAAETRAENDSDNTDVVEKNWTAAPLNCSPEDDLNPTGTNHTITCSFRNENDQLTANQRIHAEATGANDPDGNNTPTSPDFECTTRSDDPLTTADETGTCTFTHGPGGNARTGRTGCSAPCNNTDATGTTTYRAWVDTDNDAGTFNGDATEGVDENTTPGAQAEGDRTDVVQKRWTAGHIDCVPETDTNPAGAAHSVTCEAKTSAGATVAGVNIDAEATGANDPDGTNSTTTPDFTCTTESTGRCSFTHGPGGVGTTSAGGTTTYRAWIDIDDNSATQGEWDTPDMTETQVEGTDVGEPDNTDVVSKTWIASRLDCTPESDTNPAETAHTISCNATDSSGVPQAGIIVDAEATGANDIDGGDSPTSPDFTCTTETSGSCSFTHGPGGRGTTNDFGRTIYRAWIDADNNDATAEADPTEGRDESTSPSPSPTPSPSPSGTPDPSGPGTRAEPDDTDVVEKNWSAVPTTLQIDPETDSAPVGSCNAYTVTATDAQGAPVQFVVIDVEQRHTSTDNATPSDEPTVSFCTPAETDGPNPSSVDSSRGDLGDGSDGAIGGEADKTTNADGKVSIGIRIAAAQGSDGTGDVLVTAFYENEDNDDPDTGEPQDSATKTWTPSTARTIDCEPESATKRVGNEHSVTCTVRDAAGNPVAGEGVRFTEDGPGDLTSAQEANTDSQGRATVTVSSGEDGTQTVTGILSASTAEGADECDKAAGDPEGAPAGACSDAVEVEWRPGARVKSGPCKGFFQGTRSQRSGGGVVLVGTKRAEVLRGTDDDDIICGLGGKDTIIGRDGDDLLHGGGANDILRGNAGNDVLRGAKGLDTLAGGSGNDRVFGGASDDTLRGGGGRDLLKGQGGKDVLRGRSGRDTLKGGKFNDNLNGGPGNDLVDGGPGTDVCRPGPGNDRLRRCER